MRLPLLPHPESRCDAVTSIDVDVARDGGAFALRFVVSGRIGELALPALTAPARTDDLWRHTCFEAFIRADGEAYYEFNAAPSTQWAAYRFDSYRAGMSTAYEIAPPALAVTRGDGRFELAATLSVPDRAGPRRLALSAVIEESNGRKSYWALAHAPGKPDFHHADAFALVLAEPT